MTTLLDSLSPASRDAILALILETIENKREIAAMEAQELDRRDIARLRRRPPLRIAVGLSVAESAPSKFPLKS